MPGIRLDVYGFAAGTACPSSTASTTWAPENSETSTNGHVFYSRPGLGPPTSPTTPYAGDLHFSTMGTGGSPDLVATGLANNVRFVVVGDGVLAIETTDYSPGVNLTVRLYHAGGSGDVLDDTQTGEGGDTFTVNVSSHGQTECTHWVDVSDANGTGLSWGYAGATWTLDEEAAAGSLEYRGTLPNAFDKSLRIELDGTGSGAFSINRYSSDANPAILTDDCYIRAYIPDWWGDASYFGFWPDTSEITLADQSGEAGVENLSFQGGGSLAYLNRARLLQKSYISDWWATGGTTWYFNLFYTGTKAGQILYRLVLEAHDGDRPQDPLPLLTVDFDYDDDSEGDAWTGGSIAEDFTGEVGEDYLSVLGRLLGTGDIEVQMGSDLVLHAYNAGSFGRDLTGSFGTGNVRFERGVNIARRLAKQRNPAIIGTHAEVGGDNIGDYPPNPGQPASRAFALATLPTAGDHPVREVFIGTKGADAGILEEVGLADLDQRLRRHESVSFPITLGDDESAGLYGVGPAGSDGHFWVGDTVTVHTGTGDWDIDAYNVRVVAITIAEGDAVVTASDLDVTVEAGGVRLWGGGGLRSVGSRGQYTPGMAGGSAPGRYDTSIVRAPGAGSAPGSASSSPPAPHTHSAGNTAFDNTEAALTGSPDTVQEAIEALASSLTTTLRWEAVTDGEDVFVWESDDLVHEWKEYA